MYNKKTIEHNQTLDIKGALKIDGETVTASALKINSIENLVNDAGDIELVNTVWDDLRVPVTSTRAGGSKDPDFAKILDNGSGSQGVFVMLFDQAIEEELYFALQIPHSWKLESTIHAHVHWLPTTDGTEGQKVCWGLEYTISKLGSTFGNTTIIYGDTHYQAETIADKKHYLTEIGEVDMTGVDSVSPMLICRVFRDAAGSGGTDDFDADVGLIEIDFHFEINTLGSKDEYIK